MLTADQSKQSDKTNSSDDEAIIRLIAEQMKEKAMKNQLALSASSSCTSQESTGVKYNTRLSASLAKENSSQMPTSKTDTLVRLLDN